MIDDSDLNLYIEDEIEEMDREFAAWVDSHGFELNMEWINSWEDELNDINSGN